VRCYVLLGGESKRMGSPKQDLLLRGASFVERVVSAAAAAFPEVTAVTHPAGEEIPAVRTIRDRSHESRAAMWGVARALEDAGEGRIWIVAVDYPLVTAPLLAHLARRFEGSASPLLVPRAGGKSHILCAGWSGELLPLVERKLAAGDLRLSRIEREVPAEYVEDDEIAAIEPGEPLANVNDAGELERIRRLYGEG
jgi:molybdenum cofactor guanylyltransferase